MSDEKPPMPPQPITTKLQAASLESTPEAAKAILDAVAKLTDAVGRVDDKVDTLATNVEILKDDGRDTKQRLIRIEGWKEIVDDKLRNNSERAKVPSQHDLTNASELSEEISARKALAVEMVALKAETAVQTAMLTTLTAGAKKLAANPTVHTIAILLGAALIAWLKGHL